MTKRKIDLERYHLEVDNEKSTFNINQNYSEPDYDYNKNDKFFKTRHYFKLFLRSLTTVVVKARAEKRLNCIKNMISKVFSQYDSEQYKKFRRF